MAYQALGAGDTGPLLAMLGPDFEWVEPELPGYPLAGDHRGPDAVERQVLAPLYALFDDLVIEAHELTETAERAVVTGVMRGRPSGAETDWELPFAHVWEISDGEPVRVRAYFDRSRLTVAAARRQLADVADDLLEQAAEIRRQWAQLEDAMRAAGVEPPDEAVDAPVGGTASARLAAVDMAEDGATREEVDAYLRDELGVEDTSAILDEVFTPPASEAEAAERAAAIEANRLSKLFARNRS